MTRRRDLLIGLGAIAAGAGALRLLADAVAGGGGFVFEPMDSPAGFRRVVGAGGVSGAADPFAGLALPGAPVPGRPDPIPAAEICGALFGTVPPGSVPIAAFSDQACPYCRVLDPRLAALEASGEASVTWYDLPLLGEGSRVAALAVAAAEAQGGAATFRDRLFGSAVVPTVPVIRAAAEGAGLDPERLLAEMDDPAARARLARSEALAAAFGVIGTPTTVVGRSVVAGALGADRLDALVALEREAGPVPGCA